MLSGRLGTAEAFHEFVPSGFWCISRLLGTEEAILRFVPYSRGLHWVQMQLLQDLSPILTDRNGGQFYDMPSLCPI